MPLLEFIAGWISEERKSYRLEMTQRRVNGAVGLVIGYPLDTVKVRLQTQSVYSGIFDCMVRTYKHEGFGGFFKGMTIPVLSIAVSNAVSFGSYCNALDYLTQSHRSIQPPLTAVFTAGCFSGVTQLFVTAPIDLVKVRLQNQTDGGKYRGPVHCLTMILREDGPKGLFRGFWALALRDVPCFGLYFLPYEWMCRMLSEKGKQPGTFAVLMAGGVAGVVTWACATPMDVMKARLQMSGAGGRVYDSVLHCITVSVREEGVRVFFRGLLLNSVRAFPVNAVTFLSFEMIMRNF